jgi:predicted nucleic acid-binding Zn ribbon protein
MDKYLDWIKQNVTDKYGKCKEVTEKMAEAFPELQRVRGHYHCPIWGKRDHWWLTTEDGEIVDPTAGQFPSGGLGEYAPWEEGSPEPTGMCPNCGGDVYDNKTCCSDKCSREYARFCMGE